MRSIVMLVAAAALLTGRAAAQPAPWQPERLSAGWVFTPSMAVGGLWDSNVTVANEGSPLTQEWLTTLSPRGELNYNGRRLRFNTGYAGTFEAYPQLSELNQYEQRARVDTSYQTTPRLRAEARASYSVTPSTDRLEIGTLPFLLVGGRSFDMRGGFRLAQTSRATLAGHYNFQQVSFDQNASAVRNTFLQGGYAHGPVASLMYAVNGRFSAGGEWQYQKSRIADGLHHFDVQSVLGQVSYQVAEHTSVSGAAGVEHARNPLDALSAWGPSLRAGLTHQLDRTSLSANYSRSFVPTFSFGGGLSATEQFSVKALAPITRGGRLMASGSVSYSRNEPVETLGLTFALDSWWTNVTISYHVTRWLSTEAFVSTMHQTTTASGNFDRARIGIQFVTFKPVRIQ